MSKWGDNYPVGLSVCEEYGMNGSCGLECPLFKKGKCEEQEDVCNIIQRTIDRLQFQQDGLYQQMWEELKNMVIDEIELLQNWCGGCSVCKTIPEPKDWSMTDIVDKLQELENKYLNEKEKIK